MPTPPPPRRATQTGTRLLVAGALIACALFATLTLWPHDREQASAPATEPTSAPAPSPRKTGASSTVTAAALFAPGVAHTYQLVQTSTVVTEAGQPVSTLALRGTLRLVALSGGDVVRLYARFAGSLEATAGGTASPEGAALVRAASQPFVLELADDGSFLRALGAQDTLPMVGRAFSALGESLQLTRPERTSRWQAHERDAAGSFVADYEDRSPREIQKHKRSYEALASQAISAYEVLRSTATFALDDAARLSGLALDEQLRVKLEQMPAFIGASTLHLTRSEVRDGADLQALAAEVRDAVPLKGAKPRDEDARERARIGGMSEAEALDKLAAFSTADAGAEAREAASRAFVALTALLRHNPKVLEMVRARIARGGPDTHVMLAALRDASTPGAQALLASLSAQGSPLDPSQRLEAARSLSRVATPNAETVTALTRLRGDPQVGVQATYGLGSALHRLQDGDPKLAEAARRSLLDQLDTPRAGAERVAALIGLGNAGDRSTLDAIRRYAADPSADVRAAVAQAVRRIPGPEADQILAAVSSDRDAAVAFSVVDAIAERAPSPVLGAALTPLALGAESFKVRAAAVNTLARFSADVPGLTGTLRQVAASDPNADLRRVAEAALRPRDAGSP